jgi:hypothetical protein
MLSLDRLVGEVRSGYKDISDQLKVTNHLLAMLVSKDDTIWAGPEDVLDNAHADVVD